MKLLIGMPSYSGLIPWETVTTLLRMEYPCLLGFVIVPRKRIDKARNEIAVNALANGYDYLLFIDDDNPVPPDTVVKLLEDDKDIVTAPVLTRKVDGQGEYLPCIYKGKEYDGVRIYSNIRTFGEGYLHKIDACGMACTLIKRKVLETLHQKYKNDMFEFGNIKFDTPVKVGEKLYKVRTMSEDMEFCERAVDAGFEIWTDTRIRPLHLIGSNRVQWNPPDVNTSSYWDEVWGREGQDTWRKYPSCFQKIASQVTLDDSVLDVGCGVGVLLDVLRPLCREVAGLDISPKAIEILKSKGIQGKVGTLPILDFPDKSFDVVVATETLEHLDDPEFLIREMRRVARKKVIISVPNNTLGPGVEKEHRQIFTKSRLNEMLSKYFTKVEIEDFRDEFKTPNVNISLPTLLGVCEVDKARNLP